MKLDKLLQLRHNVLAAGTSHHRKSFLSAKGSCSQAQLPCNACRQSAPLCGSEHVQDSPQSLLMAVGCWQLCRLPQHHVHDDQRTATTQALGTLRGGQI